MSRRLHMIVLLVPRLSPFPTLSYLVKTARSSWCFEINHVWGWNSLCRVVGITITTKSSGSAAAVD